MQLISVVAVTSFAQEVIDATRAHAQTKALITWVVYKRM